MDSAVTQLAERGFAIVPDFFPPEIVQGFVAEIESGGEFKRAAVGKGGGKQVQSEIRTDEIFWIDPDNPSPIQSGYWSQMESLRERLNRELFLGLNELEAHLARFAPGGYYKPHLDRHRNSNARILSTILYLDTDWDESSDGGELRIFTDRESGTDGPFLDVFPKAGQLVAFLSADFWHEVRVASRHRRTVTGWFRGRETDF